MKNLFRIGALAFVLVLPLSCIGCGNRTASSDSTSSNLTKLKNCHIGGIVINTGLGPDERDKNYDPQVDKNKIFRSYKELDDFVNKVIKGTYENKRRALQQFNKYTEKWFEGHILYYSAYPDSTGSIKYSIKDAAIYKSKDGKQSVIVHTSRYCPEYITEDMAYYCFFIEFNRDEVEKFPDDAFCLR